MPIRARSFGRVAGSLAVLAGAAGGARADGSELVFAGPTAAHPTSLTRSPAALPLGQPGNHVYVAGALHLRHQTIDRRGVDLASGSLTDLPSASSLAWSPGGRIAIWTARRRYALGVTFAAPPAEVDVTDERADAPWRYSTTGGQRRTSTLLGVGGAYGVTSRVYVGFAFEVTRTSVRLGFARDTALAGGSAGLAADCGGAACGLENPLADERYQIDASPDGLTNSDHFAIAAGAMVEVAPRWWVAAAYRTHPGLDDQLELVGTAEVTAAPRDGGATSRGAASVFVRIPSTIDVGVRGPIRPGLELTGGARWTDASRERVDDVRLYGRDLLAAGVPERLVRPRGLRDPFRAWLGVEQADLGQRLRGGARLLVTTAMVDAARTTPATIDGTSLGVALGGQVRLTAGITVQLGYTARWWPTVDVTDSAYDPRDLLACEDAGGDLTTSECEAVRDGYARPSAAGRYLRIDQGLTTAVRYDW